MSTLPTLQWGSISPATDPSGWLTLVPVYHASKLCINLIPTHALCASAQTVTFNASSCVVRDPSTGKKVGVGHRTDALYYLDLHVMVLVSSSLSFCGVVSFAADLCTDA